MRVWRLHVLVMLLILSPVSTLLADESAAPAGAEIATGPEGLLQMEQQGRVTVRALRGWGRLPDEFMRLAQDMRKDTRLDLLNADLTQIRTWVTMAQEGDPALVPYQDRLGALAGFMEQGNHLDWQPQAPGVEPPVGALVRSNGQRFVQTADGLVPAPGTQNTAAGPVAGDVPAPEQTRPVPAETVVAADAPPAAVEAPAMAQSMPAAADDGAISEPVPAHDAGPVDGLEFDITDQHPGTFRVRLRVSGLRIMQKQDDPYFERMLPQVLPDNPQIADMETAFFRKRSDTLPVSEMFGNADRPYDVCLGFAEPGQPITIGVEAPANPEIQRTEVEIRDNVTYRIKNKSMLFLRVSEADGNAEIDYADDPNTDTVSWTPRADAGTGRPVGPRAIGVYMAYHVKKFVGAHEMGTLRTQYRRVGWVVIGMPGDAYAAGDSMYEVGKAEAVSGSGAEAAGAAAVEAETFDFELSEYALKEQSIRLSDDMRHVAWVDGTKDGKKRVMLNGVAGKWYDDVKGYAMRLSEHGEMFCYQAEMGDREIPVCNGQEGPLFKDIDFLFISPDGSHVLVGGETDGGVNRVFLDGKQVRETRDSFGDAAIPANGLAAWTENGQDAASGAKYERVVWSDGREGQKYVAVHGNPKFFGPRNELYYVAEKDGGKRYLIRETEELQPTMGSGYAFTVTPDGAHYAFVAELDTNVRCMIVDGKVGPEYASIWNPAVFNADGSVFAYVAEKDKTRVLMINDREISHDLGPLYGIQNLLFSPDGQHWAAALRPTKEEFVIYMDGQEKGRGTGAPHELVFSPDSRHLAWIEDRKTVNRMFLDGQAGPEVREIYDDEPPQFSPDSSRLVYFSRDKDRKMHISVMNGPDRMHDLIPPRAVFTPDGLEYLALDGKRLHREHLPYE